MIVIGLGSGRSGTASLAKLLAAQHDAICFHELNPASVRFSGTLQPILNTIDEFQAITNGGDPSLLSVDLTRTLSVKTYELLCSRSKVRLIGDIAFYYLQYVENIVQRNQNVRFICLRRDKEATVESWMRKSTIGRWRSKTIAERLSTLITREPFYHSVNHWMEHDGTTWMKDPIWDKCFPKFNASSKRDAIRQYWDYYYATAQNLENKFKESFRIVQTETLNELNTQNDVLGYCGVASEDRVFADAHTHKSSG